MIIIIIITIIIINRSQVYLMFSGNEFHMCTLSYLNLLFPNLLCFGK